MGVFDSTRKLVTGDTAVDAVDSGSPISIGGRASSVVPTAVSATGDRVRAWFDLNGRLVVDMNNGPTAHDAADAGNPIKIGGKASSTTPTNVASGDRVDAYFDLAGRQVVAVGANVLYRRHSLSPADPTHGGTSDITTATGTAIASTDLTIRNTSEHWFYIPHAISGYRTCIIYLENDSTVWDQVPYIQLWGAVNTGGGYRAALLLATAGTVTASVRMGIGTSAVGVGGREGVSPLPTAGYYYYTVPAIVDGWPYLAMNLQFPTTAPTTGEFDDIVIVRQG